MPIRRELVGALSALLIVACSAAAAGPDASRSTATELPATTPPAVVGGVGALPAELATTTTSTDPATTLGSTSSTAAAATTEPFQAGGNRMLLIGDSILASTSKRYSNTMCSTLVPMGWQVAVEAEVSRGIDFARTVWQARDNEPWDVVLVLLGANYGGDEHDYLQRLNTLINDVGASQIVLVTVSEYEPDQSEVNRTLRAMTDVYANVSVLDWANITAADPSLLNEDGIHPTEPGRTALARAVAFHVGDAPTEPGSCLKSVFTDDSAGSVDGRPSSTTVKPRRPSTTTTVKPSGVTTSTTVSPTGSPTTTLAGGTPTTPTTSPTTTVASSPVTLPPVTTPAQPQPSTTLAPQPG